MIRRLRIEPARLPLLLQLGLLVLAVGGGLDVVYHSVPAPWELALDAYLGPDAFLAHVTTLAGMVLTLLGIITRR